MGGGLERKAGDPSPTGQGWRPFTAAVQRLIGASGPGVTCHGILIVRLPGFEKVFSLFGYGRAEQIMEAVTHSVRAAIRGEDRLFLLGSHELGLLLPQLVSPALLELAAHKIRVAVAETLADTLGPTAMPARMGAAVFPDHGGDADTLLRAANAAASQATRERQVVVLAAGDGPQTQQRRLQLAEDLVRAFERDQFRLFLQPQLDLSTRRVKSAEALLRWEHERDGVLSPAAFLPLADELDLMGQLTEWVVQNAVRILTDILETTEDFTLAINIPPDIIVDSTFGEWVAQAADLWHVEPGRLTLEITEDAMLADPVRGLEALEKLRTHGFRIAIDDFGTGFSSLSYLSQLGLDELKIDRSFVTDLGTTRRNVAVVRSVVDLARNFGIQTVAEGVEDSAARDFLVELGVNKIQGFWFSRPIPEAGFLKFLRYRESAPAG